jgi:hypothetical protein
MLSLENVDFQDCDPYDLHKIINIRDGLCSSLSVLRLAGCSGLMANDVELLKTVVKNVEWDGYEEWNGLESEWDGYEESESEVLQ